MTSLAIRQAFEAHGYSGTDEEANMMFEDLQFTFSCAIIDAVLLVANGKKTIQPEDFVVLSKLHTLLSDPMTMRVRSHKVDHVMRGGTSLPLTYFDPTYGSGVYIQESQATQGHGGSTTFNDPLEGEALARSALAYSAIGGAGASAGKSKSKSKSKTGPRSKSKISSSAIFRWHIPSDNISKMLREYKSRFNKDVRITDAAKLYLRAMIKLNMDSVLDSARSSSKSTRLTVTSLRRAVDRHVLLLVLA